MSESRGRFASRWWLPRGLGMGEQKNRDEIGRLFYKYAGSARVNSALDRREEEAKREREMGT